MTAQAPTMPTISASPRDAGGKSAARRLRASGQIPAIAYGKELGSAALTVGPKDVLTVLKSERGQNSVVKVKLAGKDMLVMIRDFTYHPVTRSLEHVDFVEVHLDRPVDVEIPVITTGKPVGVTMGGIVRQVYRELPIRCLPDRIPVKVEVDITHLNMNEGVHAKDVKLPEGVSVRLPPEQTIVAIVAPEKDREAEAAAAAAATPGAAAPAAGAAAAKTPAAAAKTADAKAPAAAAKTPDAKKK